MSPRKTKKSLRQTQSDLKSEQPDSSPRNYLLDSSGNERGNSGDPSDSFLDSDNQIQMIDTATKDDIINEKEAWALDCLRDLSEEDTQFEASRNSQQQGTMDNPLDCSIQLAPFVVPRQSPLKKIVKTIQPIEINENQKRNRVVVKRRSKKTGTNITQTQTIDTDRSDRNCDFDSYRTHENYRKNSKQENGGFLDQKKFNPRLSFQKPNLKSSSYSYFLQRIRDESNQYFTKQLKNRFSYQSFRTLVQNQTEKTIVSEESDGAIFLKGKSVSVPKIRMANDSQNFESLKSQLKFQRQRSVVNFTQDGENSHREQWSSNSPAKRRTIFQSQLFSTEKPSPNSAKRMYRKELKLIKVTGKSPLTKKKENNNDTLGRQKEKPKVKDLQIGFWFKAKSHLFENKSQSQGHFSHRIPCLTEAKEDSPILPIHKNRGSRNLSSRPEMGNLMQRNFFTERDVSPNTRTNYKSLKKEAFTVRDFSRKHLLSKEKVMPKPKKEEKPKEAFTFLTNCKVQLISKNNGKTDNKYHLKTKSLDLLPLNKTRSRS